MKLVHKSEQRSLWSAAAWRSFPSFASERRGIEGRPKRCQAILLANVGPRTKCPTSCQLVAVSASESLGLTLKPATSWQLVGPGLNSPAVSQVTALQRLCIFLLIFALTANTGLALATRRATRQSGTSTLSAEDQTFLEDLSRRSFSFFWEQADPTTGLVLDRAHTDGSPHREDRRHFASIAATGFGLTALCIAAERRWVEPRQAREQVRTILRFFAERSPHEHGWFYHFVDSRTGERFRNSELSSIDTALLLGGVLTARQRFRDDAEIVRLATRIYERVDFQWMLNGHPTLLSHGWRPESGFIKSRWDHYSEHTMLYLLAIGSPTHPISPESWWAWRRDWVTYGDYHYLAGAPTLFTHQYSHAWVDYRGRREDRAPHIDYFQNSVTATQAHRAFCLDLAKEFPGYSAEVWGISASDSAHGYVAWGGPPRRGPIDGTVVPCAAGGSLMFTPEISLAALRAMREKFGERIYGRYGFADAFNPATGWVDSDVIGIDVGITLLSAENLRTGNVWRWFGRNPEPVKAMRLIGLRKADEKSVKRKS